MFEYIKGNLEEQALDYIVVDLHGMGYHVNVSANTMAELPKINEPVKLHLHPVFKEDDITLYGFTTRDEREIFRTIINISGIGPKAGMGLLSQFTRNELIKHILHDDPKAISKAPGIGLKTASRIILELKDKYKNYTLSDTEPGAIEAVMEKDNTFNESVNGLMGLGYSYTEASDLVERIMKPGMPLEDILKEALMSANPLGR
ncbi:MAG: Holliday junction branch migration protein RuvA [Eubacterium sp.]